VSKEVEPDGSCEAHVFHSADLATWTRAHDVNDTSGSSQVLAVAADATGFVSVGSHNAQPALWTTANGTTWITIVLPLRAGATGVLQQIAVNGGRVVAAGVQTRAARSARWPRPPPTAARRPLRPHSGCRARTWPSPR
jgi:hypothetical protein